MSTVLDRYLEQIIKTCGAIDARGVMQVQRIIELPLDQVFVSLTVKLERREVGPFSERLPAGPHGSDGDAFDEPRMAVRREPMVESSVALEHLWRRHRHWVLLGDPGAGKTTVVRNLAWRHARDLRSGVAAPLPILVTLRYLTHSEQRLPPDAVLLDYLRASGLEELGFNPAERAELVKCFIERLAQGEALLLLDGLDEQRDPTMKQETNEAVTALLWRFPRNQCLITSRIVGYGQAPLGGEFRVATIEPFTDGQMQQFFENWHLAVEKGEDILAADEAIRRRAQRQAADLIGQIRANPGIRSLAANPLLCTIIGLIHRQGGTLPQHRVELYKLCVDTFIFNWEMHKRRRGFAEPGLDKDETQAVLEALALHLHEHGVENRAPRSELEEVITAYLAGPRGLPIPDAVRKAAQLLDLIRDVAGLLIDRGEASYGFFHLAFQEYLSAPPSPASVRPSRDTLRVIF